jgi:hypothetical protein
MALNIMSRSFKHNAVIKDHTKGEKKRASKKARKLDLSNGGNYKKAYESYDISDYKFRFDKQYNWTKNGILDFIKK